MKGLVKAGPRMRAQSRGHTLKQKTASRQQSLLYLILTKILNSTQIFSNVNPASEKPKSLSNPAAHSHSLKARLCGMQRFRSPGSEQLDKSIHQLGGVRFCF